MDCPDPVLTHYLVSRELPHGSRLFVVCLHPDRLVYIQEKRTRLGRLYHSCVLLCSSRTMETY